MKTFDDEVIERLDTAEEFIKNEVDQALKSYRKENFEAMAKETFLMLHRYFVVVNAKNAIKTMGAMQTEENIKMH